VGKVLSRVGDGSLLLHVAAGLVVATTYWGF
jgi:hypothetical protein